MLKVIAIDRHTIEKMKKHSKDFFFLLLFHSGFLFLLFFGPLFPFLVSNSVFRYFSDFCLIPGRKPFKKYEFLTPKTIYSYFYRPTG